MNTKQLNIEITQNAKYRTRTNVEQEVCEVMTELELHLCHFQFLLETSLLSHNFPHKSIKSTRNLGNIVTASQGQYCTLT